jgi:hypothetical protein
LKAPGVDGFPAHLCWVLTHCAPGIAHPASLQPWLSATAAVELADLFRFLC